MPESTTSTTTKRCVACGADVTHSKRMKDSDGRYWCVTCGEADQKRKKSTAGKLAGGGSCAMCGDAFPDSKLTQMGGHKYCPKCLKARSRGPGLLERAKGMFTGGGGEGEGKAKVIKLLVVAALLAAIAWWINFG